MSVARKALHGGAWMAALSAGSQIISWSITLVIARLLQPDDYALMEMATILTGYVYVFNELGLGSAIIQRKTITDEELSSLFWVCALWGALLGLICLFLAEPTVHIFHEYRLRRITQLGSLIFIFNSFYIVPRNVLYRELRYKQVGAIEASAVIFSCVTMFFMAYNHAGVWTLVIGQVVREGFKMIAFVLFSSWKPKIRFRWHEAMPYLKFGLPVVFSTSLRYVYFKADIFFGGRRLSTPQLGHYSFALRLSEIPNNKIVSLLTNIAYPVFARLQDSKEELRRSFLRMSRLLTFLTFPMFFGAILVSSDLIPIVLGAQWIPTIRPFQLLCVGQIFGTLNAVSHTANFARGKPGWRFVLDACSFPVLIAGFWVAAKWEDPTVLAYPWMLAFPLLQLGYLFWTMTALGVSVGSYFNEIRHSIFATIFMVLVVTSTKVGFDHFHSSVMIRAIFSVALGGLAYLSYVFVSEKELLLQAYAIVRKREVST